MARKEEGEVNKTCFQSSLQKVNSLKVGRKIVFSYPLVAQTDMPQQMKLGSFIKFY